MEKIKQVWTLAKANHRRYLSLLVIVIVVHMIFIIVAL